MEWELIDYDYKRMLYGEDIYLPLSFPECLYYPGDIINIGFSKIDHNYREIEETLPCRVLNIPINSTCELIRSSYKIPSITKGLIIKFTNKNIYSVK